ncbi:DUF2079 domain-containing protein [Yinghuangia aomiensis]
MLRFRHVENPSWDLAIFEQAVKAYCALRRADRGRPPARAPTQLGDHFSPILATLALFYRVFPSAVTLLVGQAVLFALAVIPVTRGGDALPRASRRGTAIGIAYGLSWGVQRAVDFDSPRDRLRRPDPRLPPGSLLRERRARRGAARCSPLLLVKEDLGLTVGAVGVYLLVRRQWRLGAAVMVIGAAVMALTVYVLIPALNPDGVYDQGKSVRAADRCSGSSAASPERPVLAVDQRSRPCWCSARSGSSRCARPSIIAALSHPAPAVRHPAGTTGARTALQRAVLMPADRVRRPRRRDPAVAGRLPRPWMRTWARNVPSAALGVARAVRGSAAAKLIEPDEYKTPPRLPAAEAAVRHVAKGATVETDLGLISSAAVPGARVLDRRDRR